MQFFRIYRILGLTGRPAELKDLDYEQRLKRLDIRSMVHRSFRGDMIETYKSISGYYDAKPVLKMDTY